MSEKDEANLLAILDSAEKIIRFSEAFFDADISDIEGILNKKSGE